MLKSDVKKLLDFCRGVIRSIHGMSNGPAIGVDLIIITTNMSLVAKEVNSGIVDSTRVLCVVLEMLQTIRLIPASREDIERYLATNRVPAMLLY